MAGSLVPHSMAGARQCVFSYGTDCPTWKVRRRFDPGDPWPPLGMGEDEGLALFQKTRGCLPAAKAARLFRLSDLQHRLPCRNLFYPARTCTSQTHFGRNTHLGRKYAQQRQQRPRAVEPLDHMVQPQGHTAYPAGAGRPCGGAVPCCSFGLPYYARVFFSV